MKFSTLHKALVAALAITAASPASASIAGAATGNGELFFSVFDSVGQRSYTRDLGITMNTFLPTNDTDKLFAADTLFASWLAATAPANFSNIIWHVLATENNGADRSMTTSAAPLPGGMNSDLADFSLTADVYTAAVNTLGTHPGGVAVNGSSQATPSDGSAYFATGIGSNWNGKANFNTSAKIGQSLDFYLLSQSSQAATALYNIAPYTGGTWTLGNTGTLVYAVPEADTWAMFAGGLLALGAIARRRKSA